MICFNCKKQIPDGVSTCPACGAEINPQHQVIREIKQRRWQRYVLYGVIAAVFLGMTAYMIKVMNDNTVLLSSYSQAQTDITQQKADLAQSATSLQEKDSALQQQSATLQDQSTTLQQQTAQISDLQKNLTAGQVALNQKTADWQKALADQTDLMAKYGQFTVNLGADNANIYNFLVTYGVGTPNKDLSKVPLADFNLNAGVDSDNDGLSDVVEAALGTDPNKADTNGNGFNDKQELMNGYDAIGKAGKLTDVKFINDNRGKVLLEIEHKGEAWYINPKDGKRYFLGRPADALKALEQINSSATPEPVTPPVTPPAPTPDTTQNQNNNQLPI